MSEVAAAYVTLMPSAKGFGAATASQIGPQMGTTGKAAGGILGTAIGVAAGAALAAVGIGVGLFKIGAAFDDMNDTIQVGTGATGKALEGLSNVAKDIGKTTPSSFNEIGTAVAGLNSRLGLTGKPLESMATKILNLSRITGTDLSGNIADLSRVFGDWGISIKDQPAALDKIFYTSQKTGVGLNSLAQSVVQMGAPLRQFGFSFEESLAMFGKWEKEGVNTTAVMSGLKIGLGKFSAAGKDPQKALAETEKAIKNAGSAGEANAIAIAAFGQRAGPDMAAAVREGRFELGSLVKGIEGSGGAIQKADQGTRDFSETWQVFKNNVLLQLEPIATRVFAGFSNFAAAQLPNLIAGFAAVGTAVSSFVADFRNGVGVGGQFAAAVAQIGAFIQTQLVPAFLRFGAYFQTNILPALRQFGAFLTSQVLPAIATVAAFILGTFYPAMIKIWGVVAQKLRPVFDQLVATFQGSVLPALNQIAAKFREWWPTIQKVIAVIVVLYGKFLVFEATVAGKVLPVIVKFAGFLISKVVPAVLAHISVMVKITGAVIAFGKAVIDRIQDVARFVSAVKEKFGEAVNFVQSIPGKIKSALGDLSNILYAAGRQVIEGLVNGIVDKARDAASAAAAAASAVANAAKGALGIHSPSKVFHDIGGFTMQGLIDGMIAGTPGAVSAALGAATKVQAAVLDKLTSMRDKVKGVIDGLRSDFDSLRDSISSAFSGDLFSATSMSSFLAGLSANRLQAGALGRAFKKLEGWGLSPKFLSQLFQSGNAALILDMAAGSRADARMAQMELNAGQSLLSGLGTAVARDAIGPRLDKSNELLDRIEKTLKHLPKDFGKELDKVGAKAGRSR